MPGSYFFGAGGGLGYGLPAAVGVQLAQPERPVVAVIGDGSMQYAIAALWSAVAYEVPLTVLVLRNEEYAILKWFAEFEGEMGAPGLDVAGLDSVAIASGYGMRARRVEGSDELAQRAGGCDRVRRAGADRSARSPPACRWVESLSMALLEPDVRRIAPEAPSPAADRVPDSLATGTPEPLRSDLIALLGADRVLARVSDLVRYASDASPYRMIPKSVVMAHDVDDVVKAMGYARRTGVPITFRAAGTSLNGQAQGDGVMVDVRRHWRGVQVEDDGARVRVLPGTLLGHVNAILAEHGRRLGPDPASTDIATVGGVVANNSGGMRCGVVHDSYRTVRSLTFALPSGTVIDTAHPEAEAQFAAQEPDLARGLLEIRDELRADTELAERIRRKFEIKNTMGYRLIAFLEADTPLEIFRRLIVGSEGTLAFVSRGRVRHGALRPAHGDGVRRVPRHRRGGRLRAAAGAGRCKRDRADDGPRDEGGAGIRAHSAGVERRSQRRGRDPGRVPLRRPGRARRARGRGDADLRRRAPWCNRRSSRAIPS